MNLVYRYGLLRPDVEALVIDQMRAAHTYRNRLTEIERARRAALRDIDTSHSELSALHARVTETAVQLASLVDAMRRERARTRKRSESAELRDRINASRAAAREARRQWMERRRQVLSDPIATAKRDRANEMAHADRVSARAECDVYWGTYQLIEDQDQAARKTPLWDGDQPNDPRFIPWRGQGAVSVQIICGASVDEVMGCEHTQVRLEHADEKLGSRMGTSRRRSLRRRMVLWLRIGSLKDRSPAWARWPMVLHRPLPPIARVKRVSVHRRMIGPRVEWYATFALEVPQPTGTLGGAVGVDVGWRQRPDGSLRVAVVCAEHGKPHEIVVPPEIMAGIRKADEIRSVRDRGIDAARAALVRWLGELKITDEWREATSDLARWRSPARLAGLALWWRSHPLPNDDVEFWALETWRYHDWHLWRWETSQRTGALRRRRDWYRVVAAGLAMRYSNLVLEDDAGLASFAGRPDPEAPADNETARSNRVLAAVSELRQCLVSAFRRRGELVSLLPAANTTRTCHVCGVVETWDAASNLRHQCANGHAWDQDVNAARNLIERWRAAGDGGAARIPQPSVSPESRWQRARRLAAERADRMRCSHAE